MSEEIGRKSLLVFYQNVIGGLAGLAVTYLVAHYMGQSIMGIIGFSLGFIGMFYFITDLGFNYAHLKRISEGKNLGKCVGTLVYIKIALTFGMIISFFSASAFSRYVLEKPLYPAGVPDSVILIFLAFHALISIRQIPLATYEGRRETARIQVSLIVEHFVKAFSVVVVVSLGFGVVWLSGAYLLGILASTGAAFVLWKAHGYTISRPSKEYVRSYTRFAIPIFLPSVLAAISLNIDKVTVGYFWGIDEVGIYFGAQRIAVMTLMIPTAVSSLLFPTISSLHSARNWKGIKKLHRSGLRYLSMVLVPLIVVGIIFAPTLVGIILGGQFTRSVFVLQVLLVYSLLFGLQNPFVNLINGMDRPKLAAKVATGVCVTNIALNLVLVPLEGPMGGAAGAAIATAISAVFGLFFNLRYARKMARVRLPRPVLKHLLAGIGTGAALFVLSFSLPGFYSPWLFIPLAAGAGGIYLGMLATMKEFKRKDFSFFLGLLNPATMKTYVAGELKAGKK